MTGIEPGAFGALALLILVVAVLVIVLYLIPVRIWIAAFASGAYVGLFTLVGMRLRRGGPAARRPARAPRVGEGMVSTIGSSMSHKDVLENPDHISKRVLAAGLDAGTAYEILSIDIADVDVGENIGAKLQIDQANADKQIAQAKAEERRAMAVALGQERRARGVGGEAEVPR